MGFEPITYYSEDNRSTIEPFVMCGPKMCFSAKLRWLLAYTMLHTFICFRLRATDNLHVILTCLPFFRFMGTALVCETRTYYPYLLEHHLCHKAVLPCQVTSAYAIGPATQTTAIPLRDIAERPVLYGFAQRVTGIRTSLSRSYPRLSPHTEFLSFESTVLHVAVIHTVW